MAVTYDFQTPGVSTSAADTQEDIRNIAEMSWVWHVQASPHSLTNKPTGLIEAFYSGTVDFASSIPSYGYQNYYSLKAYDGTNLGNVNFIDLYVHYDGAVLSNTIGARGEEYISMGVYAGYSCEDSASWIINADVGNSGSSGYDPILAFKNQTTERARIYTDTSDSHKLKFDVGGSDQMVIDSSGNVGIGTSSPARKVTLYEDSSNESFLHFANYTTGVTSTDGAHIGIDNNEDLQISLLESGKLIEFYNAGNQAMVIDSSGNVGIGTSSPSYPLEVKKVSGNSTAFAVADSSDTILASVYVDQSQGGILTVANNSGTNNVFLSSYGNSYLNGGNVGIGTSSPNTSLQISRTVATNNTVLNTFSNLQLLNPTGSYTFGNIIGAISFGKTAGHGSGMRAGIVAKYSTTGTEASNIGTDLVFRTALNSAGDSSEKMVIDSSGNVEVNTGNLVIGTSGKGIDFSATSGTGTSELLDDYEEGTFTPTLVTTGTNFTSVGYSVSTKGRYTKIGNTVHVYIRLATDSVNKGSGPGAATGNVAIGGLPFTCNSDIYLNYSVSVLTQNWSANPPAGAQVVHNTKLIYLYQNQGSTGDITNTSVSDVGTGTGNNDVTIVGTYRV